MIVKEIDHCESSLGVTNISNLCYPFLTVLPAWSLPRNAIVLGSHGAVEVSFQARTLRNLAVALTQGSQESGGSGSWKHEDDTNLM